VPLTRQPASPFEQNGTTERPTTRCRPEGRRAAVGGAWANPVISCGSSSGRCCTMCRHIENIASARSACPCKRAHPTVPNMQRAHPLAARNGHLSVAHNRIASIPNQNHRGHTIGAPALPVSRCVAHARSCPRQCCERMLAQLTAEGRRRTQDCADVARASPVPVQLWRRQAQSQ